MSAEIRGGSPALPSDNNLNSNTNTSSAKKSSPPRGGSAPRDILTQRLNNELNERFQKNADEEPKPLNSKSAESRSAESTTPRNRSLSNLLGTLKQSVVKLASDDDDKKAEQPASPTVGKNSPRASNDRSSSPRTERVSVNFGKDLNHLNRVIQEIADTELVFLEGLQEAINRMNLIFRLQKGEITETLKLDPFYRAIVKYQTLLDITVALRGLFVKALEADNFIEKQKLLANAYLSGGTYKLYTLVLKECSNLSGYLTEHAKAFESDPKNVSEIKNFRKQNPKFEKLDESSLYITPLQRIVRHELLLKSVRQVFSPSSQYYKDLTAALEKAEKTAKNANYDQRRIAENIPAYMTSMAEEINSATEFGSKQYSAELLILAMSDLAFDIKDYTFIFRTLDEKVKDPQIKVEALQLFFETVCGLNKVLYDRLIKAINKQQNRPVAFLEVMFTHVDMLKQHLSNQEDNAAKIKLLKENLEKFKT